MAQVLYKEKEVSDSESKAVIAAISEELDKLEERAKDVGERFRLEQDELNKDREKNKSLLGLRVLRRGETSLAIEWVYVAFLKTREGWKPRTKRFTTNKLKPSVSEPELKRHAQGWMYDVVKKYDDEVVSVKRLAGYLSKSAQHARIFYREDSPEE